MNLSKLKLSPLNRFGVTGKFILAIATTMALLFLIAGYLIVNLQDKAMESELLAAEKVINDISQQQATNDRQDIQFKAKQLSQLLSAIAPQPMVEFDLSLLGSYADMAIADPDVSYVAFLNKQGKPFAVAGDKNDAHQQLVIPVENEGIKLGELHLGYNFNRAQQQLQKRESYKTENFANINQAKDAALTEMSFKAAALFFIIAVISMFLSYVLISRLVKQPLARIVEATDQLADGNLIARVDYARKDELGHLADKFNTMADAFQHIIRRVSETAGNLRSSSEQMSEITNSTISQVKEQHRETEQVATAMTEMATTVEEVARNTTHAAESAGQANDEANKGKQVVYDTIKDIRSVAEEVENTAAEIQRLTGHAQDIGTIIDVIQSIAEQTNLLALNAAIEAARAGEQGRGFAVVADEVRTLAQRTQESTQEIEEMIHRVQSSASDSAQRMQSGKERVHASVEQAQLAGTSLDTIAQSVATITEMTTQIASAAEEQSAVANDMHRHITQIRDLADMTAGSASQTEAAGKALLTESDELNQAVQHFKV